MNCKLMTFAEKRLDRFRREVAMAGADVDDEWIQSPSDAWQWFVETLINRLTNKMFDDGSVWCRCSN